MACDESGLWPGIASQQEQGQEGGDGGEQQSHGGDTHGRPMKVGRRYRQTQITKSAAVITRHDMVADHLQ